MLTAADLTSMRNILNDSLPGTAVIQSGTLVSDGGGEFTETFTASGTVDCRVASTRGSERDLGERISSDAEWIVTLPALTSIEVDDRIVSGGGTFHVVALRAPRSYEVSRRIEARQIT